jgi:hypothetical protein
MENSHKKSVHLDFMRRRVGYLMGYITNYGNKRMIMAM